MIKLIVKHLDQTCCLCGLCACLLHGATACLSGHPIPQLNKLVAVTLAGCTLPIGILFLLSPFCEELAKATHQKKSCNIIAGIAILYVTLMSII